MIKRIFVLFVIIFSISNIFSTKVDIYSEVNKDITYFTYKFYFDETESYDTFSFEKPKDSIIIYANDLEKNSLFYSSGGDYFIFKPESTKNKTFEIKFKTKKINENILEKKSYSNYLNFNFPINELTFKLKFNENFGKIIEVFPREYELTKDNEYIWRLHIIEKDLFFLVNFKDIKNENTLNTQNNTNNNQTNNNQTNNNENTLFDKYMIAIILISFIFLIVILYSGKKILSKFEEKKTQTKPKKIIISKENQNPEKLEDNQKQGIEIETYEEFIKKYLTDNEKEVVQVIKENEGLTQNEILSYIPELTKSNLSKIITKLNSKKIVNRIKVGKVNKIHLGNKLKIILENEKEEE